MVSRFEIRLDLGSIPRYATPFALYHSLILETFAFFLQTRYLKLKSFISLAVGYSLLVTGRSNVPTRERPSTKVLTLFIP